jgi:predicted  nucleic acid-binding Zn-ribbon protein
VWIRQIYREIDRLKDDIKTLRDTENYLSNEIDNLNKIVRKLNGKKEGN